jgi:flavin-dependent dehydrogenase
MTVYDALIVGGGPAGAALATHLARAGRGVALIEKEAEPHDKVCGEFISHEGAAYLSRLGVSLAELGAESIGTVRLSGRKTPAAASLPFTALSLSRRALDEALLSNAVTAGAGLQRGQRIKALRRETNLWRAEAEGGRAILAREAFLATGKHDLKDWRRPPGPQPDLLGFKMYWQLSAPQISELAGAVELILFPGGYAGLQTVEGERANLCLLVRQSVYSARYGSWDSLLNAMLDSSPHLSRRLGGAVPLLSRPLAISRIPYGFVARGSGGLWRLGDQAAVIPSFSGDGMSIALHSAHLAAQFYLKGTGPDIFQRELKVQLSRQVARATLLSKILVRRSGQRAALTAASICRSSLKLGAALTRIPEAALTAAGSFPAAPQRG